LEEKYKHTIANLRWTAMLQNDETVTTLMNLGLTSLQAKTYLALTELGRADAQKVSKLSNVARQDIYRIMPTLEKLGLVEKAIAKPTLYKAVPLKDGCLMLLKERIKQQTMLQNKIKSLLNNNNKETNVDATIQEDITQFVITSERKLFSKRIEKAHLEARTADMIIPADALNLVLFNSFESLETSMKKGAEIRIITGKREGESTNARLQTLKRNPLFEIRSASSLIDFAIVIFNKKEVNMCISVTPSEVPSLWTNNPRVVRIAQTLFESIWADAQDYS
jgi:sugar-specific transcriptional regulator TrmB